VYIDTNAGNDLRTAGEAAAAAERAGYDGIWISETNHDPFFPLLMAVGRTDRLQLGTGVAIAFARSPMTTANAAWDLNAYSQGRFVLGLGTQIKAHVERRFSMPWSQPAARMREFVLALRAIWDCWQHGTKLDFRGEFYSHTLMTPFFDPGPNEWGPPRVFLAAVGDRMTQVAGEVADGLLVHPFTTQRYFHNVTMPTLEAAIAASGRTREEFTLKGSIFVVTGETEEAFAAAHVGTRKQIAFYGSTPAYRGVFEQHGWGDLQTDLHALSKRGEWDAMGTLIDDEVLDEFAVVAEPGDVASLVLERVRGVYDRIGLYTPYDVSSSLLTETILPAVKAAAAG
jgi:probable F420-dependent oxidoreductase